MQKPFYITTPIYYVNDKPHLGHAYTSVACDVIARFKRLDGYDVKFLTGTDEHGQKVEKSAEAKGVEPQAFVDSISGTFRDMAELMHISHDDFIRTTEARQREAAQAIWQKMEAAGHIYLDSYAGWYSVRDEAYYAQSELIDGKAPTGAEVEWVEEPSYFFRLSAFEEKLLDFYDNNQECIGPSSRRNEVISFVKGGLRDLSISRTTFSWGIKVPGDEKHIMYVWLDALVNYLSALGYGSEDDSDFQKFWPADLHIIGKDILRFHAVYWPAFLMAADLPLPKRVFAHGWWTVEGEKMSKTTGNVIAPADLVEQYGLEQTRWFILREVPFGNDGNFSHQALKTRCNAELANNIGNLVQRTLSMVVKNCDGIVPDAEPLLFEQECLDLLYGNFEVHKDNINNQKLHIELEQILAIASYANGYIDRMAPWTLKKTDPQKMEHVLYVLLECIRCLGIYLQPVMPDSASKILDFLSIDMNKRDFSQIGFDHKIIPGSKISAPEPLFARME